MELLSFVLRAMSLIAASHSLMKVCCKNRSPQLLDVRDSSGKSISSVPLSESSLIVSIIAFAFFLQSPAVIAGTAVAVLVKPYFISLLYGFGRGCSPKYFTSQ